MCIAYPACVACALQSVDFVAAEPVLTCLHCDGVSKAVRAAACYVFAQTTAASNVDRQLHLTHGLIALVKMQVCMVCVAALGANATHQMTEESLAERQAALYGDAGTNESFKVNIPPKQPTDKVPISVCATQCCRAHRPCTEMCVAQPPLPLVIYWAFHLVLCMSLGMTVKVAWAQD